MMKTNIYQILLMIVIISTPVILLGQGVAINEDSSEADPSAMLDIKSSAKGFLMPRMTAEEIASIDDLANGLIVFSTTDNKFYTYILAEDIWKEIAYGSAQAWTCGDPFIDSRDSQSYSTVQIGEQCWMAENLNIGTMINGSSGSNQTDNDIIEKYCYSNDTSNCDSYGGLYQWNEMMEYVTTEEVQGICPTGWHLPTKDEWTILIDYFGGQNPTSGNEIKSCRQVNSPLGNGCNTTLHPRWNQNNNNWGTDTHGFSGLPGGIRDSDGPFNNIGNTGHWWSTTSLSGQAWFWNLHYFTAGLSQGNADKPRGFSVRCLGGVKEGRVYHVKSKAALADVNFLNHPHSILELTDDELILDDSTYYDEVDGLVTDGVTPLYIRWEDLEPDTYTLEIEETNIEDDSLLIQKYLQIWNGTSFSQPQTGSSLTFTVPPGKSNWYAFVQGIPANLFNLYKIPDVPDAKVKISLRNSGDSIIYNTTFLLALPPVAFVHGYNAAKETWTNSNNGQSPSLDILKNNRPNDFVESLEYGVDRSTGKVDMTINIKGALHEMAFLLDVILDEHKLDYLKGNKESGKKWALTRFNVVGHSQGGVLMQYLCSYHPRYGYAREKDFYRGRFNRVITVGSPHNGSRLAYYLIQWNEQVPIHELAGATSARILTSKGILQSKFDPWGPEINYLRLREINEHAPFHLIATSLSQTSYSMAYRLFNLNTPENKKIVFGNHFNGVTSDGVVDIGAQHAGLDSISKNYSFISVLSIAHALHPGYPYINVFGADEGQTTSTSVAIIVNDIIDSDSTQLFGLFEKPTKPTQTAKDSIDLLLETTLLDLVKIVLGYESILKNQQFEVEMEIDTLTIEEDIEWLCYEITPNGYNTEGIEMNQVVGNPKAIHVDINDSIKGCVYVKAIANSTSGKVLYSDDLLIKDQSYGTLVDIQFDNSFNSILYNSEKIIELNGIYDEGTILPIFYPEIDYQSADTTIASITENGLLIGKANGFVEITASYNGFHDTIQIEVYHFPSVQIISPTDSTNMGSSFSVEIQAQLSHGIDSLIVYDNDQIITILYTPIEEDGLYEFIIPITDAEDGEHLYFASVVDTLGRKGFSNEVNVFVGQTIIEINVFLEGSFNVIDMETSLNPTMLPLSQPYNIAPWNYSGTESVPSIPSPDVVDWVLVEFRDAANAVSATNSTTIKKQAAFILSDGSIVGMDGSSNLEFTSTVSQQLYVVVRHRNHIDIISSNPLTVAGGMYTYNFTSSIDKAYGGEAGYKYLASGTFAMAGGDADASSEIDIDDKYAWASDAGAIGYNQTDFNLDGQVNNQDKNNSWVANSGIISQVPSCGGPFIDSRDGQIYNTVQIGTQCWMAENLNIGMLVNGTIEMTNNSTIEKYCYGDDSNNCDTYGGLYQWAEMMEYVTTEGTQGICPTGWHLPTDEEWCTLENEVDIGTVDCNATELRGTDVGGNLKEIGSLHWASPNTGATNSSGFTGLPVGYRLIDGSFDLLTTDVGFWTSSEGTYNAWARWLASYNAQMYRDIYNKDYGFGVRCLRDD